MELLYFFLSIPFFALALYIFGKLGQITPKKASKLKITTAISLGVSSMGIGIDFLNLTMPEILWAILFLFGLMYFPIKWKSRITRIIIRD